MKQFPCYNKRLWVSVDRLLLCLILDLIIQDVQASSSFLLQS